LTVKNVLYYRRQNTNFRLKIPQQSDVQTNQSELLNSLLQKLKHFESEKLSDTGSQAFHPQLPVRGPDTLLPVEGVGRGQSGEQQSTGSSDLGVIVVGWKDGKPGKAFRIFVRGDVDNLKTTSGDNLKTTSGDNLKTTSGDSSKATSGDGSTSGDSSKATSGDGSTSGDGLKLTSGDNLKTTSGSGLTGTSGDDGVTQNIRTPSLGNNTKATSGVDQQSTSGLEHSNVSSQLQKINEKMESEMKPILTQFFNIFGFKTFTNNSENDQNMTQHNSSNHSGLDKLKDWFWESASNMTIQLVPML